MDVGVDMMYIQNIKCSLQFGYILMVMIQLRNRRAQRDVILDLHSKSFGRMLPYIIYAHYDHLNILSSEGESSLRNGDWLVKISKTNFKQVNQDQAQ